MLVNCAKIVLRRALKEIPPMGVSRNRTLTCWHSRTTLTPWICFNTKDQAHRCKTKPCSRATSFCCRRHQTKSQTVPSNQLLKSSSRSSDAISMLKIRESLRLSNFCRVCSNIRMEVASINTNQRIPTSQTFKSRIRRLRRTSRSSWTKWCLMRRPLLLRIAMSISPPALRCPIEQCKINMSSTICH